MRRLIVIAVLLLGTTAAGPALAQTDLVGSDTVSGMLDLRLVAADGERSFLRGGFGKTEASGAGADVAVRPMVDLAAVAWRPELAGDLTAYVLVQNQAYQHQAIDLAEAYLQYRPSPHSPLLRYGVRAGLFWPPVSLEHDGPAWTLTRTLTPSAINTWIAEEVKVAGVEGTLGSELAGNRFSLTAAVFGDNDTAGTLLAFRGWALDDTRSTLNAEIPLPSGPPRGQAYDAQPSLELDGRPGGYVQLDWRPPAPLAVQAFYYDNAGDPRIFRNGQWAWRTSFADLGAVIRPAKDVELLAQAAKGRTFFGDGPPWFVYVTFESAYVLATRVVGRSRFTVRADWFDTKDQVYGAGVDRGERGKAGTADYAFSLTRRLSLWVEAAHVWSNRAERARIDLPVTQTQTVLRVALRATL